MSLLEETAAIFAEQVSLLGEPYTLDGRTLRAIETGPRLDGELMPTGYAGALTDTLVLAKSDCPVRPSPQGGRITRQADGRAYDILSVDEDTATYTLDVVEATPREG